MRSYSVSGSNATGSATKTLVTVIAATTVRPRIFDLIIGNSQTPADQAAKYMLSRFTAAGTAGSSPTPQPLDPVDVAALSTAGAAHSAEPTYAATPILGAISLNQRATFRYVATPGAEIVAPATAANGLGVQLVASTAAMISDCTVCFYE